MICRRQDHQLVLTASPDDAAAIYRYLIYPYSRPAAAPDQPRVTPLCQSAMPCPMSRSDPGANHTAAQTSHLRRRASSPPS